MSQKSYLILGASGGIGRALCAQLSTAGARIVAAAPPSDRLDRLATDFGAETHALDATNYEAVQALIQTTARGTGGLQGIANCVGSVLLKPAHLTSLEEFEAVLSLNLRTAFYVVKAATRALMSQGGSIVLCSSAVVRTGLPNHAAIAAAKGGVEGLVRAAAASYARRKIRINAVAPGLVATPATARIVENEASRTQSEALHALGRIGQPAEVARAIAWLLDDDQSGWVTGQVWGIDGGLGSLHAR